MWPLCAVLDLVLVCGVRTPPPSNAVLFGDTAQHKGRWCVSLMERQRQTDGCKYQLLNYSSTLQLLDRQRSDKVY